MFDNNDDDDDSDDDNKINSFILHHNFTCFSAINMRQRWNIPLYLAGQQELSLNCNIPSLFLSK